MMDKLSINLKNRKRLCMKMAKKILVLGNLMLHIRGILFVPTFIMRFYIVLFFFYSITSVIGRKTIHVEHVEGHEMIIIFSKKGHAIIRV